MIDCNVTELYHSKEEYEVKIIPGAPGRPAQICLGQPPELTESHLAGYRRAARQVCVEIAMLSGPSPEDELSDDL